MRLRQIERIIAARRKDCTDRELYDMIDHVASSYFFTGLGIGTALGLAIALFFIMKGH